jgi:CheY-like chemotaxis protein
MYEPDAYERKNQYIEHQMYRTYNRNEQPEPVHIKPKDNKPVFYTAKEIITRPKQTEQLIKTGITEYDKRYRGLRKSDVTLLSGQSGAAKSTLMSQLILNAVNEGNNVAVFSGELGDTDFMRWLNQQAAGKAFDIAFIDMIMKGALDGWHLGFDIHQYGEISTPLYLLVPEGQMHENAKMKFLNLYKGYLYKPVKKGMLVSLLTEEFSGLEPLDSPDEKDRNRIEIEELPPALPSDENKSAEGLKILVAEDHPMNRKLLQTFLKRFGAQVYLAENGEEALTIIKNQPEISMIFMDIYMPVKNGIEATKEIRAMHFNEIIIACTANNDTNDFKEYKKIGINDILVKPFKSDTLRAIIEKWKAVIQTLSVEQINLINGRAYIENTEDQSEWKTNT